MKNPFKRKTNHSTTDPRKAKTLAELIEAGVIDPAAIQQQFLPQGRRVSVKFYRRSPAGLEKEFQVFYRNWKQFRAALTSAYLGHSIVEYRDVPSGVREPIELIGNLGAGYDQARYDAAREFLVRTGSAKPVED